MAIADRGRHCCGALNSVGCAIMLACEGACALALFAHHLDRRGRRPILILGGEDDLARAAADLGSR